MRRSLLAAVVTLCTLLSSTSFGAERIIKEWDFTKATDTLGWTAADQLSDFRVVDGALALTSSSGKPKIASPIFDISAAPGQYVEVEMKSDSDGSGMMYYSNTTEPPYAGFRPELYTTFEVKGDGVFHRYVIRPFWQKQGKVIHIRLDPPGKSISIRAIRIIGTSDIGTSSATSWDLRSGSSGWQTLDGSGAFESTPTGCELTGDSNTVALSPALNIEADDYLWVTLRIASKTNQTALFRWASDQADGLQAEPISLRADKAVHSYSIPLGDLSAWNGKVMALGVTPSDSASSQSILVESIALGNAPVGPAELAVTRFGLEYPFLRAGQKGKLVIEVKNTGGQDAESVAGLVTLALKEVPQDKQARASDLDNLSKTHTLPNKRIAKLAPGKTARFEWEIELNDTATRSAVCRVIGKGLDAGEKAIDLTVHPKLAASTTKASYVPEPAKADTDGYMVGAYYYPGWQTRARWSVLDDYPGRKPILGYYREGDPEVVDWQINWALSHGISYFIYDWYWSQGARQLEHAIHDAFLKSKYQSKFKFCLLWANHNPPKTSSEKDLLDVTRYWIENYFRLPNYLKVNGRNVMVIFSPHRLTEDMGADAVKAAFPKMRRMCEDAGVGSLYMIACTYPGKSTVENLAYEGYDALSGYNYPAAGNKGQRVAPYEWMVEGYKDFWNQISDAASIPYIPVCDPGWDSRPWHGNSSYVRTGKTPRLFEQMLENAKAFVDNPKHAQPGDKKLVFLEAWNEFGEGDYIEPHAEFGFDYLEAVRSVFAPRPNKPTIVVPKDLGMGPYELPIPPPQSSWDFSNPKDQTWTIGNMSNFDFTGGVMRAQAQGADPAFYSPGINLDAAAFKTIEIRMRMDKGCEAQLFFTRPKGRMSEEKSVRFAVTGDNEFHVYTIDLAQAPRWQGIIGQVRLDPNSEPGSNVEIAYVRFR